MQTLGVSRFTVEGKPGGPIVFACLIPVAGRQAVTERFEAEGRRRHSSSASRVCDASSCGAPPNFRVTTHVGSGGKEWTLSKIRRLQRLSQVRSNIKKEVMPRIGVIYNEERHSVHPIDGNRNDESDD